MFHTLYSPVGSRSSEVPRLVSPIRSTPPAFGAADPWGAALEWVHEAASTTRTNPRVIRVAFRPEGCTAMRISLSSLSFTTGSQSVMQDLLYNVRWTTRKRVLMTQVGWILGGVPKSTSPPPRRGARRPR